MYVSLCPQDSIAALQALVDYANLDTNRAIYNVEVVVQATSMGNFSESVRLDRDNWPDLQVISVSTALAAGLHNTGRVSARREGGGGAVRWVVDE